jgi:hypothetical protein
MTERSRTGTRTLASLVVVVTAVLALAPAAQAKAHAHGLSIRVANPAAGDISTVTFELQVIGRKKVTFGLTGKRPPGEFAVLRTHQERHHPDRLFGVLVIFHRAGATAAVVAGRERASTSQGGGYLVLGVHSERLRVMREVLKANIVALASAHRLGHVRFCDPQSVDDYLLGDQIIGAAYFLSGAPGMLPMGVTVADLMDDAIYELCDYDEDEAGDDEDDYGGIRLLNAYVANSVSPTALSFAVNVIFSYFNGTMGTSNTCFTGSTSPAQPISQYTATVSGPNGFTQSYSGITNASGHFAWTVNVNQYGSYTGAFDVTSKGVTEAGTVSGTVSAIQGSNCTAPVGG